MAAKQDGRTVIWEVHPDHPTGEIFVSGDGVSVEVAPTVEVAKRIKDGLLVQVQAFSSPGEPAHVQPLPGYDDMNVATVLEQIASATDEVRTAIQEYEAAHKARKTILEVLA
jgi:hypothetical protein